MRKTAINHEPTRPNVFDNAIRIFTYCTLFVLLSVIWALSSVFLVTLPPSTAALMVTSKRLSSDMGYRTLLTTFGVAFVSNFFKSYIIVVPILVTQILTYADVASLALLHQNWLISIAYTGLMLVADVLVLVIGLRSLLLLGTETRSVEQAIVCGCTLTWSNLLRSSVIGITIVVLEAICFVVPTAGLLIFGGSLGWLLNRLASTDEPVPRNHPKDTMGSR